MIINKMDLDSFKYKIYKITDTIDNIGNCNINCPITVIIKNKILTFIKTDENWTMLLFDKPDVTYSVKEFKDIISIDNCIIYCHSIPSDLTYVNDISKNYDWNKILQFIEEYIIYKITNTCRSIYSLIDNKEIFDINIKEIDTNNSYLGKKLREKLLFILEYKIINNTTTTKNPHYGYCISIKNLLTFTENLPKFYVEDIDKAKEIVMQTIMLYKNPDNYILENGNNFKLIQSKNFKIFNYNIFTLDEPILNIDITSVHNIKEKLDNDKLKEFIDNII